MPTSFKLTPSAEAFRARQAQKSADIAAAVAAAAAMDVTYVGFIAGYDTGPTYIQRYIDSPAREAFLAKALAAMAKEDEDRAYSTEDLLTLFNESKSYVSDCLNQIRACRDADVEASNYLASANSTLNKMLTKAAPYNRSSQFMLDKSIAQQRVTVANAEKNLAAVKSIPKVTPVIDFARLEESLTVVESTVVSVLDLVTTVLNVTATPATSINQIKISFNDNIKLARRYIAQEQRRQGK